MRDVYAATFLLGSPKAHPGPELLAEAAPVVLAWVADKYGAPELSAWDAGEAAFHDDRATWGLAGVSGGEERLWQLDWRERDHEAGLTWQTRCQIGSEAGETRFTVRIAIDSPDTRIAPARFDVGRPNVILKLAGAVGIHRDGWRLRPDAEHASSGGIPGLLGLLLAPSRRLPVVVLTPTGSGGVGIVDPGRVARRLIGLAHVVQVMDRDATFLLTDHLGNQLSVYGGAIRVYWPGLSLESNPRDHPLWLVPRLEMVEATDSGFISRLERQLAAAGVVRVPPDSLEAVLRSDRDAQVVARITHLTDDLQRLRSRPGEPGPEWLTELEGALDAAKGLQTQVEALQRDNEELKQENVQLRRSFADYQELRVVEEGEDDVAPPAQPGTSSEAFRLALELPGLQVPDSAAVALDELDSASEARSWARSSWRAFQALDAYSRDATDYRGFHDWCTRSPSPGWSASEKKLAMSESETVMNSRELREKRLFPIDRAVDPSGRRRMYAHIKVSEGGGQQIPRIYFYDDTKGSTGKVHIGFFGPHRFVPNKGAN